MHSKIFQLKTDRSYSNATSLDIPESFSAYVDYWDEIDQPYREANIEEFKKQFKSLGAVVTEDSVTITDDVALRFFAPRVADVKRLASALTEVSLRQFAGLDTVEVPYAADVSFTATIDSLVYNLKSRFDDECGYWIIIDGGYPITLDEFMRAGRNYCNADTYFFGTVFDYHF